MGETSENRKWSQAETELNGGGETVQRLERPEHFHALADANVVEVEVDESADL